MVYRDTPGSIVKLECLPKAPFLLQLLCKHFVLADIGLGNRTTGKPHCFLRKEGKHDFEMFRIRMEYLEMSTSNLWNWVDFLLHSVISTSFTLSLEANALFDRFANGILACTLADFGQIRPAELVRSIRYHFNGDILGDG